MSFFLLLLAVVVVLGVLGLLVKGLLWLLFIGIVVFLASLFLAGTRFGRGRA